MGLLFRLIFSITSKIVWIAASIRWPYPFNMIVLGTLCRLFGINLLEAEKPLTGYHSFQDIFTRQLKPGSRHIAAESDVISPADGVVMDTFSLSDERPLYIKGVEYHLHDLLKETLSCKQGLGINIYLAPHNYHRFVMPIAGIIENVRHIPGAHSPVNPALQFLFPKVFTKNERVVLTGNTDGKLWYMILIAALNVGGIKLPWLESFQKGLGSRPSDHVTDHLFIQGEELGYFKMGSSILLLFPETDVSEVNVHKDTPVKYGQSMIQKLSIDHGL